MMLKSKKHRKGEMTTAIEKASLLMSSEIITSKDYHDCLDIFFRRRAGCGLVFSL